VERLSAYRLQRRALEDQKAGDLAGVTQTLRAAVTILIEAGE